MPKQLRPESKDLGEAATTTLNPTTHFISPLVKDESCII